jgi:hypothetical protein
VEEGDQEVVETLIKMRTPKNIPLKSKIRIILQEVDLYKEGCD